MEQASFVSRVWRQSSYTPPSLVAVHSFAAKSAFFFVFTQLPNQTIFAISASGIAGTLLHNKMVLEAIGRQALVQTPKLILQMFT